MKPKRIPTQAIPLTLLALCLVGFGTMAHRLGFYWDDWPTVWFLHFLGPGSFLHGFVVDRPLLGWLFLLTTPWLGESPLAWQVFAIFTRWLSGLALWFTLRALWPKRTLQITGVVVLFLIYPGFRQQYIAMTYGHGFIVYGLFLFSLGAMLWAYRKPRYFWLLTSLSIITSAFSMFVAEYFVGLELLRPILLWMVMEKDKGESRRNQIRNLATRWLPYLVILVVFLIWRIFFHESPRGEIILFNDFRNSPLLTIWTLLKTMAQDLFEVTALAWQRTFSLSSLAEFDQRAMIYYASVSLIAALLVFFTFVLLRKQPSGTEKPDDIPPRTWATHAILLGLFALLVGGWPIWGTNLHIELLFPWDRFTLQMMLGSSLIVVGLVELITRKTWQSALIIAVLAGMAAGLHYQDALAYRKEWIAQNNFFWQLTWRAPGLQPGTTLLTSELPFQHYSDNSLAAPLNWTYDPYNNTSEMNYMIYAIDARLGKELTNLEPGIPIEVPYRAESFYGSTSQAVVMLYDPPRCLKILDPVADRFWPQKPIYINEALPLSRLDLILTSPDLQATPPASVMLPEPKHDWCYFFEKADLARQTGNWEEVVRLADKALKNKKELYGGQAAELIPYIEGYAHLGYWEKAINLTLEANQAWSFLQPQLCLTWSDIQQTSTVDADQQAAITQVNEILQCDMP